MDTMGTRTEKKLVLSEWDFKWLRANERTRLLRGKKKKENKATSHAVTVRSSTPIIPGYLIIIASDSPCYSVL